MGQHHKLDRVIGPSGGRLELTARVGMVMLIAGGLMVFSGIGSTDPTAHALNVRIVAGLILVGTGLLQPFLPPGSLKLLSATYVGIGVLCGLLALLQPVAMVPLFFIWPVLFIAWFGSRAELATLLGVTAILIGVAVTINDSVALKIDTATGLIISIGLIGGLANYTRGREDRLRSELEQAASTDPLTGLANRRAFNPALSALIGDGSGDLAFVLIDVDHFKRFNDTHGHVAGDLALQRLAGVLEGESGPDALVARFGGEEFVVVLPERGRLQAQALVARVAGALATEPIDHDLRLTVSAGISELSDPEVTSFDRLVIRADDALYAAKAAGRGRPAWWADGELRVGTPGPNLALVA